MCSLYQGAPLTRDSTQVTTDHLSVQYTTITDDNKTTVFLCIIKQQCWGVFNYTHDEMCSAVSASLTHLKCVSITNH